MTTNITQQKCNNNKCYTSTVRYHTHTHTHIYIYIYICNISMKQLLNKLVNYPRCMDNIVMF